jgi:hypothetical protein
MPSDEKHIIQANHNQDLLVHFSQEKKQSDFSDWYITIAFYTALHFIEAIIFKKRSFSINKTITVKGKHSSDFKAAINTNSEHYVRTILLNNNQDVFDKITFPYGNLYEQSRTARYDCHKTPSNDYIDAENDLMEIKKHSAKYLK